MSANPFEVTIIAENVSLEDFLEHYHGQNVEWHAGKVIEKVSNNEIHQALLGFLYTLFSLYLGITKMGKVYLDGYQMLLSLNQPMRQPDLLVVLKEHYGRIKAQYLDGAADIVLEISSPATSSVDRGDKFNEYEAAGIPEYWLIDPKRKQAIVYILDSDGIYQMLQVDKHGLLNSRVLERFALNPTMLWQEELPNGLEIMHLVEAMLKESS